jgi:hypothetical protein
MKIDPDLARLSRELDADAQPPAQLELRFASDPSTARHARALKRVDAQLRAELGGKAPIAERSMAPGVLSRLGERRARRGAEHWAALVAAALVLALFWPRSDPAPAEPTRERAASNWTWASRWIPQEPIAPEQLLVVEAQRLADDTRHAARSLWSSLPLSTWLQPPAWIYGERR